MKMNILLLVVLSCISLFVLWLIVSVWYGSRLRKNTTRKKTEVEKLKKEIYHEKEMKKHLGFHVEREGIPFSDEEPSYDAIADEEDTEEEDP